MYHPPLGNGGLVDGPPSPSPTRSKKRKRDDVEGDYNTPTKTRSRPVNLGLPTPNEKSNPMLLTQNASFINKPLSSTTSQLDLASFHSNSAASSDPNASNFQTQAQQMTPPASVSPSALQALPGAAETTPSRTRSSALSSKMNIPFHNLMLSTPYLLVQPPSSTLHTASLEASVLALRRVLTLHTSNSASQVLTQEQECYAWTMFAELGMQVIHSLTTEPEPTSDAKGPSRVSTSVKPPSLKELRLPAWAPNPGEMETAISRALRLADQVASLRWLRHNLTLLHAQLVCLQDNHKHAKVLLKRLLPLSTNIQPIAGEKVWASYGAHLAITDLILKTPSTSTDTIDVQAALSQLNALFMLGNQYGDYALVQLVSVIRFTTLFHNYELSDKISVEDMYNALKEAEDILGLDGFDKPPAAAGEPSSEAAITSNSTPSNNLVDQGSMPATPFTADLLAGGNSKITANIKTPAFSFPTNPLGMNVYSTGEQQVTEAGESALQETPEDLIPPYLRYLRVHTLMLGILWLTHSGESTRSSERLTLLHEMMDKLNDLSKGEGWTSENESCLISIPLHSNPERPLRIQSTHPRVLYQLTFVISSIAKRDCLGRKPKRKVFAQEVLRISSADDPRAGDGPKPGILDGGSVYDFAPGLGLRDMRYAQRSITHIRATAYYELVAACLIRSEFEEAEQHLADLVSFLRTPAEGQPAQLSMWDQYASRITLLYGHLAHALGQAHRAMECYQTVCFLEKEESIVWCMGKAGEIVLRIGAAALRAEARGKESSVEMTEDQANDQQIWSPEERERLVEAASELVDRCLNSGLGEHMAVVGRVIAASLCAEIVRTKQNLKSGLDMACKGRDNYMRLLVLIFTAGQYLYTHTEYALTILESSRQLASSLGAVTGPIPTNLPAEPNHRQTRSSNTEERFQYHVGHARGGLWIGQRFAELYKRRGESEKAAKQNAVNTVFQKAIDTIDLLGGKVGSPDVISILDEFPLLAPPSQPAVYEAPPANRKRPKVVASTSKSKASKRSYSRETADFSEQSQGTSASYPPSSPDPESRNRSQRSGASHGKNAIGSHSHSGSIASTASGRSLRSRGERKVIIESDDEEDGQKAMSEDDFEGSELEESDGDVHL